MRLTWKIPNKDGTYGQSVVLDLPEYDHAYLRDLWEQVERMPRSSPQWRPLFNELRTQLDLRACFPGGAFVEEEAPAPTPVPPAYLRRIEQDEAQVSLLDDEDPSRRVA